MSACTCVLASFPGRSHRQPVFDHSSMMCIFRTGSDQILAVETTWERGYVCTVYALGCDLASCSFPRDYDVQTYYMYGHHSCNNVRPTFRQAEVHMAYIAVDQLSSAWWRSVIASFLMLCRVGTCSHPTAWAQWDLCTHTTQARWDFGPYTVSSIAPDPAGEQMKGMVTYVNGTGACV